MKFSRKLSFRPAPAKVFIWFTILLVVAIGSLTIIGWDLRIITIDKNVVSKWTAMRSLSAACFIMAALALACLQGKAVTRRLLFTARAIGVALILMALTAVDCYLVEARLEGGWSWIYDELLILHLTPDTRMSLITAVLFSLYGSVLLLLGSKQRYAANIANIVLIPITLVAYLVIIGYLFGISFFYEWRNAGLTPSLYSAIAFFALAIAAFLDHPHTWLMKVFTSREVGGKMSRRFLPAILIIPILIGWLRLAGERTGVFGLEIGAALMIVVDTLCFCLLLWFNARSLNRTDLARQAMEAELQISKDLIETAFDAISDALSVIDTTNFTILGTNKAFRDAYGANKTAVHGKCCYEITHQRSTPCVPPDDACPLIETLKTNQPAIVKHLHKDSSGSHKHFEISAFPIRNTSGEIQQIVHVARDVTERNLMEAENRQQREELSHLSRLATIGEFAASIAHEIHQPLTAILNNAQAAKRLLSAAQPDIDEVHDALTDIINDNKHAAEVINNLRSFLKKREVDNENFDVNEVIGEVLRILHGEITDRNICVNLDLNRDIGPVLGSHINLQQVLLNLILNALDAMSHLEPQQRRLFIRTFFDESQDNITAAIKDSGIGFDDRTREHIFEPFYTTKPAGLGMGLSITKTIITAHGGRIWAANNPEGGATFYFTLPLDKTKSS